MRRAYQNTGRFLQLRKVQTGLDMGKPSKVAVNRLSKALGRFAV